MEERKEIVRTYKNNGLPISQGIKLAEISRSAYYYRPKHGKSGAKPSESSYMVDGGEISNEKLVFLIKKLLGLDFVDYGYIKVTEWLNQQGICINKKKVYRLMKENNLLFMPIKKTTNRDFVKYTRVLPTRPLEVLEMDIKYIYVHGSGSTAYLLTIIDTFNREALAWRCKSSIRQTDVKELIDELIINHLQPADMLRENLLVTIRNDNGSQFIANMVRQLLKRNCILQEFIRPATPQQNGHIESFHSIVRRVITDKFEFEDLHHLRTVLTLFYMFYNQYRIHSSICYLSPIVFKWSWEEGYIKINEAEKKPMKRFILLEKPAVIVYKYKIRNFAKSNETEIGNAGEQPIRDSLTDLNDFGEFIPPLSFKSFKSKYA
jgi:putative transposase